MRSKEDVWARRLFRSQKHRAQLSKCVRVFYRARTTNYLAADTEDELCVLVPWNLRTYRNRKVELQGIQGLSQVNFSSEILVYETFASSDMITLNCYNKPDTLYYQITDSNMKLYGFTRQWVVVSTSSVDVFWSVIYPDRGIFGRIKHIRILINPVVITDTGIIYLNLLEVLFYQ